MSAGLANQAGRGAGRRPPRARPLPAVGPADLSGRAVQLGVLSDAMQHPTTLYPFALSALAAMYTVFLSPFLGGTALALLLAIGGGLGAGASFAWRYLVRGEETARSKVVELLARAEARERASIQDLLAHLEGGFDEIGFQQGARALRELVDSYREVDRLLERYSEAEVLTLARIRLSARETYRGGLSVLADALEVARAASPAEVGSLKGEIKELEEGIVRLRSEPSNADRLKIKEEVLASHKGRLQALADQSLRVEELLAQADACEAALERVRIELPSLKADLTEPRVEEATEGLLRTIASVRRVQERLAGDGEQIQDQAYLRLGQG